METKKYLIALYAHNDTTEWIEELTETEYKLLKKIAERSQSESSYYWGPAMTITEVRECQN